MTDTEILTLTEADRAHRRAFMEYCVTAAESRFQQLLRVLYEQFEVWNRDFFSNQLFPPHFLILEPNSPSAEADYSPFSGWGSKSQLEGWQRLLHNWAIEYKERISPDKGSTLVVELH